MFKRHWSGFFLPPIGVIEAAASCSHKIITDNIMVVVVE
jgi:hypothetical protein